MIRIAVAESSADIARCFTVMSQLRPKIAEADFVTLVERLAKLTGSRLAYLDDDGIKAVATEKGCRQVRLVSNVKRVDAHRFYLRKGMTLEAHYFSMNVPE